MRTIAINKVAAARMLIFESVVPPMLMAILLNISLRYLYPRITRGLKSDALNDHIASAIGPGLSL